MKGTVSSDTVIRINTVIKLPVPRYTPLHLVNRHHLDSTRNHPNRTLADRIRPQMPGMGLPLTLAAVIKT